MLTIAVDAMGGDHAPKAEVEGAIRAARSLERPGHSGRARRRVRQRAGPARRNRRVCRSKSGTPAKQITMEDSAAKAVRNKRDSSIRVACRLVREGMAHGVVSAGNTGRRDGDRQDGARDDSRRGPARARLRVSRP